MVEAYFCTFVVYGFWLPNDPRGSGSAYVGSKALLRYGPATKVSTRKSVAWRDHDPVVRREAKQSLKYPYVQLNGHQALWIARAFKEVLDEAQCEVFACAILRDHVHLVVSRSRFRIERLAQRLKARATVVLEREDMHPFQKFPRVRGRLPKMWVRREWTVYLNSPSEVRQKIRYVENNPPREGLPRQKWSFVTPYRWTC